MRMRSTIVAGAIAGMTVLGVTGPVHTATALAEPTPPTPTDSKSPDTTTPSPPDTTLDVTLTPAKAAPGDSVKIAAVSRQGIFADAVATSPVMGTVKLEPAGEGAAGTGQVLKDTKAGVYTVTVNAMGHDGLELKGGAQLTVIVTTTSPTPSVSPSVPKGGVKTGGGGTAGAPDLALISAGSAIALLGVAAVVAAMRRRQDDAHD